MKFLEYLAKIEASGFSIWARESEWAFFAALIVHSLALGLVVGLHVAFNLRVLGVAKSVPLYLMTSFMRLVWPGLLVVLLSGSVLLLAYPAKALTNPVFYLKLSCIAMALTIYQKIFLKGLMIVDNAIPAGSEKKLNLIENINESALRPYSIACLILWASSIFAGRFLAYTHSVLLASDYF